VKLLIRVLSLVLIPLFFIAPGSQAGLNTYTFSQSNGTYSALSTPSILKAGTRDFAVPLPFRFRVDTVSSDTLFININGYAALRKHPVTALYSPKPLASNPQYSGIMAPFAADLYSGTNIPTTGSIRVNTTGSAPNRVFIVDWQGKQTSQGDYVNFQLRMYEGTNVVEFVYGSFSSSSGSTSKFLAGQIGLRSVDTSYLKGGIIGVCNLVTKSSNYYYYPWSAPAPMTFATQSGYFEPFKSPALKPSYGLTFRFTPPAACSAGKGAGILADSSTVCYGSTVILKPTGTADSMSYQWQTSSDNGATWNNYNGGFGGNYLTAVSTPVMTPMLYRQQATCLIDSTVSYTNATKLKSYPALTVPYYEGFEGVSPTNYYLPDCMTVSPDNDDQLVLNGSNVHWGARYGRFYGTKRSWIMTPGINLENGKTYRFSIWFNSSVNDSLRLAIGTYPDSNNISNTATVSVATGKTYEYRRASMTFTVPSSGRYFAGIKWSGGSAAYIDDLQLIEEPTQDASIDTFVYPLPSSHTCFSATTPITVRVRNTGLDTIKNVPVSYSLDNVVYGPETITTPIAPGNDLVYTFNKTANLTGIYKGYSFRAWTALSGDGAIGNDTSYTRKIQTDTLKPVPYTQPFNGAVYLSDIKWYSSSSLYNGIDYWGNLTDFFYWDINKMPAGQKDSISSVPFGPIHANTFMMFDYRVKDKKTLTKQRMNAGDTLFVIATTDCGTSRDTLLTIHGGNQYYSDSFKTIVPLHLGRYAGNTVRIGFVIKKTSTNTATTKYFQIDDFKLTDLPLHDMALLYLEPRKGHMACFGSSEPVKVVIQNNGGLSETGFPITLRDRKSATPIISYTYSGTLHYGQIDTVNIGFVTPSSKGALSLKALVSAAGDTTLRNDSLGTFIYTVDTAKAPVLVNSTICEGDSVVLDAGANDSTMVFWYANATAAMPFSFTSPMVIQPGNNIRYYATTRHSQNGRAGLPEFGSGTGSDPYSYGHLFDAEDDLFIDSMAIYPTGTGTINISLLSCAGCSSPSTLGSYSFTFSGATGTKVMVPVKTYLPKGKGYLLRASSQTGTLTLKRDSPYPYFGYPVASPNSPLVVTCGWGNNTKQYFGYYYYYDFVVKAVACESARMPFIIGVNPKPRAVIAASRAGATVTVKNNSIGGGSYLWDFGDGETSTDVAPLHTYKANGTYALRMYQTNSCGIDSTMLSVPIVDLPGVGVQNVSGINDLVLFPNPAQNNFSISFHAERTSDVRLTLHNSMGAVVMDERNTVFAGPQKITRDISQLPPGSYLLMLNVDGRTEARKLVVAGR
jgi:hypothetical protein